jgi:hypothetical protein
MDACCETKVEEIGVLRGKHKNVLIAILVINAVLFFFGGRCWFTGAFDCAAGRLTGDVRRLTRLRIQPVRNLGKLYRLLFGRLKILSSMPTALGSMLLLAASSCRFETYSRTSLPLISIALKTFEEVIGISDRKPSDRDRRVPLQYSMSIFSKPFPFPRNVM